MSSAPGPSIPADDAPSRFAEAVARAERDGERVLLTRDGKPVAAIVPIEDAERLEGWEDAQDAAAVREGMAEYERTGPQWATLEQIAARRGIKL